MSTYPASQPATTDVTFPRLAIGPTIVQYVLRPLASLKLTVFLFALAIFIVLAGTLAQVQLDIWEVLEQYFKRWFAWIDVTVFFPRSWFPFLEPLSAARRFTAAVLGASIGTALMLLANSRKSQPSNWLAVTIVFCGVLIGGSALMTGGFWFPGGALIGAAMCLNLAAAHLVRFKLQASGQQLLVGCVLTVLGILLTWLVIASGHNESGFQGKPPFELRTLWLWVKLALSLTAAAMVLYAWVISPTRLNSVMRWLVGGTGILFGALAIFLWVSSERTYLGESGMRVLWQLIMGFGAGLMLWFGARPLFQKRAGIVVLHAGIGLMMFGQWFVSNYDVEEQMTLAEGQTLNYGQDIRSVELAVIRRNVPELDGQDEVLAIPLTRNGIDSSFLANGVIQDDRLPFEIEVVDYFKSSKIQGKTSGASTPADKGRGETFEAVEVRGASGASGSSVNLASGYFRFRDKQGDSNLGTYLLSQDQLMMRDGRTFNFDLEQVTVGDTTYDIQLRFERNYHDYSMTLVDVRKDDYMGTSIPRNYSSTVLLSDATRGIENQEIDIWMNNPRRYAGETFYQSGWQTDPFGKEYTTLQVVRNQGWMIPYVACMICMVGMFAHFSLVLTRFLNRQTRTSTDDDASSKSTSGDKLQWWLPVIVSIAALAVIVRAGIPPKTDSGDFQLERFGELPLVYQGRVKPFDTLARNSLRVISDIETFVGVKPASELKQEWPEIEQKLKEQYPAIAQEDLSPFRQGDFAGLIALIEQKAQADHHAVSQTVIKSMCRRQPAVAWLLDVISGSERSRQHRVIRIYHPQVRDVLGLEHRKGYRYSLEEMAPKMDAFQEQVRQADLMRREDVEKLDLYQKKLLETDQKLRTIVLLHRSFAPPDLPALPTAADFEGDRNAAMQKLNAYRQAVAQQAEILQAAQPPLAVAPQGEGDPWQAFAAAWPLQELSMMFLGQDANPSYQAIKECLIAYLRDDPGQFNAVVGRYQRELANRPPQELVAAESISTSIVEGMFGTFYRFEAYFNHAAPFLLCAALYLVAFGLLAASWLGWRRPLGRAAYWLIVITFVVHSIALVARVYISGRPPITNLYSSAVFIGWGAVLLALLIEWFFRSGIASVVAAALGFASLLIAHKLAGDGDTFEVLQAVLDTQFWLATHVICISFGYLTTFVAGGLGIVYVLGGVLTPTLTKSTRNDLGRMIYGVLCFAIFFSFLGTVLGGLWADDSWGRFWGWDPKENGALIIVLWNALILHARWDGMVKDRGLAVLSVGGNIVTAWSWFGVNELGVGLHSYGFTEGRLLTLALVIAAHLVLVAVGTLPLSMWWSYRQEESQATTAS